MQPRVIEFVGRDDELAAIGGFLAATDALPAVLVLDGEPGIGKTTLWRAGVEVARERSFRVLEARPGEAEASLPFAALGDLLAEVIADALAALPQLQRRALEIALLLAPQEGPPPDQRTVGVAVLNALRVLAREAPVLVAVDDLQWLDSATAAALQFAARRLRKEAVAFLLARRPGPETWLELEPTLRHQWVHVGGLTLGAVHALVQDRLGLVLSRPLLRRLHELSGGNPFYALELARALQEGRIRLERGESLPPDVGALVTSRITGLPDATRFAVAAAAAVSRPTIPLIEAALGGDDASAALNPAVITNIIELAGDEIRFVHPLLASAAYALVALPARRRDLHLRLASVVADVEERARHLALATDSPDAAVAAEVDAAAEAAFGRGAPGAAAELAAQARRLTPMGAGRDARRRAFAEAQYRFATGDTARAAELVDDLITQAEKGPERARLLSRRARFSHFAEDVGTGVQILRDALAEAGDDAALRGEIEEGLAWGMLLMRDDIPVAAAHARSAAAFARRSGDEAALAEALAAQALTEFALGGDADETMQEALVLEPATLLLRVLRQPSFAYGYLLSCADEHERARSVFRELSRRAEEQGDESALAPIHNHLVLIECLVGNWDVALRHADEGYGLAVQSGQRPTQASILSKRALVEARRGDVDRARETAARALELAGGPGFERAQPQRALARGGETALWALGFAELSLGDAAEAFRYLEPLTRALVAAGIREPGELRSLPDAVDAAIGLGRLDDAEWLLAPYEETARAIGRASARGLAGRCRGLLLAARGDLPAATRALEDAVDDAEQAAMPFERGRTLLAAGEVHRRAKRKRAGRVALEGALEIFEGLGARLWEQNARVELGRIGGRAPATDELTLTERRVAELVAEGKATKDVAAALFVSPKTVEGHLSRIYAKLGVHSRTQLAHRLSRS